MKKNLRVVGRLVRVLGIVTKVMWDMLVKKPEGEALAATQEKFYNDLTKILGITVAFNEAAAPVERKRPTWYVANHSSYGDFIVLGAALRGTFAGKGEILTWPVVRQLAKAVKYIGLRREKKYNPQSQAKIIESFNEGGNLLMFPEATIPAPEPERGVVTGDEVYRFHAGLLSIAFGQAGADKDGREVKLKSEVAEALCCQAIAITVKEVNGQSGAQKNPELRKAYTGHDKTSMIAQFWRLLGTERMTIELTPSPLLEARDFNDHVQLTNEAHRQVAGIVAPRQTQAYFALMPGQDPAKRKPPVPIAAPHVKKAAAGASGQKPENPGPQ